MAHYLALSNNYDEVQVALLKNNTIISKKSISKKLASKELISVINELLEHHHIKLAEISCIIANKGPGPFTTLRVVITTVNGISFATGIPMIGVDALQAAAQEWGSAEYPITAVLFNAFGNDLYSRIEQKGSLLFQGVLPIDELITLLASYNLPIRLLGNGVTLHMQALQQGLGSNAVISEEVPAYCSIEAIAQQGVRQWDKTHEGASQLMPYYLKKHPVQH